MLKPQFEDRKIRLCAAGRDFLSYQKPTAVSSEEGSVDKSGLALAGRFV
jgi:hypothetical protein